MIDHSEIPGSFDIRVLDTAAVLAAHGADIVSRIQQRCREEGRTFVLGLAAGESPKGIYRVLVKRREQGEVHFDDCLTFCLDEYYPLSPQSPRSFYQEMSILQDRLGIPEKNRHFLMGDVPFPEVPEHCEAYERMIRQAGGIDLQLLGVGRNGHIGFNEPGTTKESRTRLVQLAKTTRTDARPLFGALDSVPKTALTMGIGTILDARALLLVAEGVHKRQIVTRFVQEAPTPEIPVTLLKDHGSLHVLIDGAASPGATAVPLRQKDIH